ncbi:XdhC family aldehyde oxidoreductase maturation factor [Clostridium tanneri]|nr:XdhC family protein [Clostridium sp. A1-XYC3]
MILYKDIIELLDKKESFALVTILDKSGSAPREKGTKMIIKRDLSIIGTVGGGIFEALTIKLANMVLNNKCSVVEDFNLSNEGASSIGMICGGNLKVLVEYIDGEGSTITAIYKKAFELEERGVNFYLISRISKDSFGEGKPYKWICTETDFYGEEEDSVQEVFKKVRERFKELTIHTVDVNDKEYFIEPVLNLETVYIFGAGHISQKLADITKLVDFKTIVLDDRAEFANMDRFKTADEVIVIPSFKNLSDKIKIDKQSYVIIVTRGHAYDKEVLSQMLKTNAKYIGMIGSKNKIKITYNNLLEEGYNNEDLSRVYAPIGLPISAQTPEEIAVSIAAELIKVRREKNNER